MRKAIFFVAGLLLMSCTITEQDKAEKLVKEYLERNANDPSSVEIISISKIVADSVLDYSETEDFDKWMDSFDSDKRMADINTELGNIKEAEAAIKHMDVILENIDNKKKTFKPYLRGYYVLLEYRAKNGLGALVKSNTKVYFDSELTKVISFDDM